ncbi:MAG: YtxH domain-containing protein [Chloroflexota bacterium]
MSENEGTASFGLGIIVGAAIGLAIGLFYAPRPGSETRTMLKATGKKVRHKVGDIIEEAKDRVRKVIGDGEGKVAELKETETIG